MALGEFFQAVLVVFMASGVFAAIEWADDRAGWAYRLVPSAIAVLSIGYLLYSKLRFDKAPDYLARSGGGFFERKGLCFRLGMGAKDGYCVLIVLFQNRFERACRVRIRLTPLETTWVKRTELEPIWLDFECLG